MSLSFGHLTCARHELTLWQVFLTRTMSSQNMCVCFVQGMNPKGGGIFFLGNESLYLICALQRSQMLRILFVARNIAAGAVLVAFFLLLWELEGLPKSEVKNRPLQFCRKLMLIMAGHQQQQHSVHFAEEKKGPKRRTIELINSYYSKVMHKWLARPLTLCVLCSDDGLAEQLQMSFCISDSIIFIAGKSVKYKAFFLNKKCCKFQLCMKQKREMVETCV